MKSLFRKIFIMGIVTLFLGAIGSASFKVNIRVDAAGATVYVDDDNVAGPWDGTVSHPYQNITNGVEHALYGDTVHVSPGIYAENVVVNKSITLIGDSKPVIDGMGGTGIEVTPYDDFLYGITVDGFDITNCSYGIYLVMQNIANDVSDLSVTIGDIILNNNTINSNSDGIFVDVNNVGVDMYGNSSVVIGDFRVANNVINSSGKGINVDEFYNIGVYMLNSTAFSMGNIEITGNTVNSSQQGIYLYQITDLGEEMYDNSSFTMGSILVNDNTVNSDDYGIAPWFIQDFGYDLYGDSSFTMGNIEFCRNTVNSTKDAIGFSQFTDFGTDIYGNSSFSMGNVLVNDNTLHSIIWLTGFGNFGAYLYENSSCTMGSVEFCRNIIYTNWAGGLTFYGLQPFGYEMYDYSMFKMGDFSVNNNVIAINGTYSGISCLPGSEGFGINVYDNAVAITGSVEFEGNNMSSGWTGISLYSVRDAIVRNNMIRDCMYGIYSEGSAGNTIYHNNFINNTIQVYVTVNCNNTWDNGYPSGGNYWSDYLTRYPNATEIDHTGIGDTAYEINANNTDHYPLMIPYETTPPAITILLPENKTYAVNASIPLTFTVDEMTTWMGYSLNGQANVTITGNTTLPTLLDGWHHVTIYANDTFSNMGFATVHFTVDTTKPNITNVVQDPLTNILPDTVVKINATVTDATSGVKQVLLNCTFTNSTNTWYAVYSMAHPMGDVWNATIPPQPYGTNVTYVIIAEDNASNTITTEQIYGYKYEYPVVPEFTLLTVLIVLFIATSLIAIIAGKKKTLPKRNKINPNFPFSAH